MLCNRAAIAGSFAGGLLRKSLPPALLQVSIIGGEPMTMPDFYDLIAYFESHGVCVDFVTNGWFAIDQIVVRCRY
jgi:hypothetical protein